MFWLWEDPNTEQVPLLLCIHHPPEGAMLGGRIVWQEAEAQVTGAWLTSRRINGAGGGGGKSWGGSQHRSRPVSPITCCRGWCQIAESVGGWHIAPSTSAMCFGWEGEINNANKLHERNTSRSWDGFRISCFSCCLGFLNRSEVLPEPAVQTGCGRVSLDIPGGVGIQKPGPGSSD